MQHVVGEGQGEPLEAAKLADQGYMARQAAWMKAEQLQDQTRLPECPPARSHEAHPESQGKFSVQH